MSIFLLTDSKVITKNEKSSISSVTCVNLKKAGMASRNIVIKTIHVVLNQLCSSLRSVGIASARVVNLP